MMYTSLTLPCDGWAPPKKTACCSLIAVNVKLAHGGGLGLVVGGEDHLPAEGEAVQCLLSFLDGSLQDFLSLRQYLFSYTLFEITTATIRYIFIV